MQDLGFEVSEFGSLALWIEGLVSQGSWVWGLGFIGFMGLRIIGFRVYAGFRV